MFSTSNILINGINQYTNVQMNEQLIYFIEYDSNILYRYVTDIYFNLKHVIIHNLNSNELRMIYPNDNLYGDEILILYETYKTKHDLYSNYLNSNTLPKYIINLLK